MRADLNAVLASVRRLRSGERAVYYTGNLLKDREKDPEIGLLAVEVFARARAGDVYLTQRRLGEARFQYTAIGVHPAGRLASLERENAPRGRFSPGRAFQPRGQAPPLT
jgi:hypothetical protein